MIKTIRWIILTLALSLALVWLGAGYAQGLSQVGLVLQLEDGSVVSQCLEIDPEGTTGLDVLDRSGLEVVTMTLSGQGQAVCQIGETGCPASDCFCKFPNYWSYWHSSPNGWTYSSKSLDRYTVHAGTIEAWSWGKGDPPPQLSFEQICTTESVADIQQKDLAPGSSGQNTKSNNPAPANESPKQSGLMPGIIISQSGRTWIGSLIFLGVAILVAARLLTKSISRQK